METDLIDHLAKLGSSFTFQKRPIPIPHELRADYRMATLLLMLHHCGWKGQAALDKLHVLNWALRSNSTRQAMLDRLAGNLHMRDVPVKFDPAFSRAIDLARGEGYVERTSTGAIVLAPIGTAWLADILSESSCLVGEKAFLKSVGKSLTKGRLQSVLNPSTIW
jgi:hypothetical protein